MKRPEAQALVNPFIMAFTGPFIRRAIDRTRTTRSKWRRQYGPTLFAIQGVSLENARALLGDEKYEYMLADRIRNLGPKAGYIYPWNIVDYLHAGDSLIAKANGIKNDLPANP